MPNPNGRTHDDEFDRTREHGEDWRADDWRNNAAERGDYAQRRLIERGRGYDHERDLVGRTRTGYGVPSGYGYNDGDYDRGRAVPYSHLRGPHHGKGPRGFERSDERIRELVNEALTDHDDIDATEIVVEVNAGEVTLGGTVDDRRMKRLAEDCVERVPGVRDVHNQLRIARTPARPDAARG